MRKAVREAVRAVRIRSAAQAQVHSTGARMVARVVAHVVARGGACGGRDVWAEVGRCGAMWVEVGSFS